MNLVNMRAISGAPYGACSPSEFDADESPVQTDRERSRAWKRRHLRQLFRETLPHYRDPTSDWARQFSRKTLLNIWENYRNA